MEKIDADSLSATELRLGLPGTTSTTSSGSNGRRPSSKNQPSSSSSSAAVGSKRALHHGTEQSEASGTAAGDDQDTATPPKAQVVGWPPVRRAYCRKNTTVLLHAAAAKNAQQQLQQPGGGLYVKVSMDGAPYLRKVDLRTYSGYRELREALDALFFTKSSSSAAADGQYAVAYEDKDGDLMLVGDVPWTMFVSSCKKLRIMKAGLDAR